MHLSPFDAAYGNGSRNVSHSHVSSFIAGNLVSEFDRVERRRTAARAAYAAVF